jgi:hypothetical protein
MHQDTLLTIMLLGIVRISGTDSSSLPSAEIAGTIDSCGSSTIIERIGTATGLPTDSTYNYFITYKQISQMLQVSRQIAQIQYQKRSVIWSYLPPLLVLVKHILHDQVSSLDLALSVFLTSHIVHHHLNLVEDQNKYSTNILVQITILKTNLLTKLSWILLGGLPSFVVYKLIYKRIATLAKWIFEMIGWPVFGSVDE